VYDSLGHRDDLVFFYTSPEELPDLMTDWGQDFQVLSIDGYEVEVNA
jgi:hypothetical protein